MMAAGARDGARRAEKKCISKNQTEQRMGNTMANGEPQA